MSTPFQVGAPARRFELDASLILIAIVCVGAVLRLVGLDGLSFRWDEDLSALAAKAIAEHGVPELPSGMIYARGILFSYLMAGFGLAFGFDEAALRLPAALVGVATIPVAYAFGRSLFDVRIGLVLAALVALSTWDIEFSRYARMYAPFELFYLLTLVLIWRHRVVAPSTAGTFLAVASALLAISLHDLGYTLAFAFLLPLVVRGEAPWHQPRRWVEAFAACALVAASLLAWQRLQGALYDRAAILAANGADADAVMAATGGAPLEAASQDPISGPLGLIVRIASQFRLPELPWAAGAGASALEAGLVMAAVIGAVIGWLAFRRTHIRWAAPFLLLIGALVAFKLFNVAVLTFIAFAFTLRRGILAFRSPDILFAFGLITVAFLIWLAVLLVPEGGAALAPKAAIKSLLDFPSFFVFWAFPEEYPLAAIPGMIGALWVFDRIARPTPDRAALFLLGAFALPTVLNGLFETRYHMYRYNVPFGPLFFTLVALGLLRWRELMDAWTEGRGRPVLRPAAVTALLAAAVLAFDFNPVRSWLVAHNAHGHTLATVRGVHDFRDFRTAAEHVLAEAGDDDVVIAFDCREYYNYIGHLDYCVVSGTYRDGERLIQTYFDRGELRDLYIATPLIMNLEQFEQVTQATTGATWVIASDQLAREQVDPAFIEYLEGQRDKVVHVARDERTQVFRF